MNGKWQKTDNEKRPGFKNGAKAAQRAGSGGSARECLRSVQEIGYGSHQLLRMETAVSDSRTGRAQRPSARPSYASADDASRGGGKDHQRKPQASVLELREAVGPA